MESACFCACETISAKLIRGGAFFAPDTVSLSGAPIRAESKEDAPMRDSDDDIVLGAESLKALLSKESSAAGHTVSSFPTYAMYVFSGTVVPDPLTAILMATELGSAFLVVGFIFLLACGGSVFLLSVFSISWVSMARGPISALSSDVSCVWGVDCVEVSGNIRAGGFFMGVAWKMERNQKLTAKDASAPTPRKYQKNRKYLFFV